jgi:glyoxylase-like metal-dependent hydrolase (beta-lactamase superfamily II)
MYLGAGPTRGDELIYVEEDRALISGDIVQKRIVPTAASPGATYGSWLAVLERLRPLAPSLVIPTHSAIGDGSLIDDEIAFITDMRDRVAALKGSGLAADDVANSLAQAFRDDYAEWAANPDWPNLTAVKGLALGLYQEAPAQ